MIEIGKDAATPGTNSLTVMKDGDIVVRLGGRDHKTTVEKVAANYADLLGLLRAVIRAFVAERLSLGAAADHANGNISQAELLEAIRSANGLREHVAPAYCKNYVQILIRAAPEHVDAEFVSSVLAVKLREGNRLLLEAVNG